MGGRGSIGISDSTHRPHSAFLNTFLSTGSVVDSHDEEFTYELYHDEKLPF
jgi:hypothetical protein